jgi:hypothetical protein
MPCYILTTVKVLVAPLVEVKVQVSTFKTLSRVVDPVLVEAVALYPTP